MKKLDIHDTVLQNKFEKRTLFTYRSPYALDVMDVMIFMLQGGQGNTGRKGNKGPRGDPGPPGPPAQAGEAGDADVCFLTFQYLNTQHLFVLQTIIVFQRKSLNHIDFAFLRNCFFPCGSNTINHASY